MSNLYDDSRSAWGASRPTGTIYNVPWSEKTEILWHYEGSTPLGLATKPHTACLSQVKAFQAFQTGPSRGWNDIGYNGLICQHGRLIEGRGILTVGAQCPDHNRTGIGIQFMVGGNEAPTPAALTRAVQFVNDAKRASGHSFRIMGHRDGIATSCPGDVIYGWIKAGMPVATPPLASSIPPVLTKPEPAAPKYPGVQSRRGSKGANVTTIQKRLRARGWTLSVDGSFGPGTDRVVRRYQQNKKLKVDGVVGPATWASLWSLPVT